MNEAIEYIGPFELRGELGQGAMARVWRAWDPTLSREVAIKEPLFDSNLPEEERARLSDRFVREARTVARLNHPGIVTIYAANVYNGNRPAIVMELVEGHTLGALLRRNGPLDAPMAINVLDQLLDAVGFAHACGVVHRDIKPDNIFVRSDGMVKLADFGIAHVDGGNASRFTKAGSMLGTPAYMSPEQARGHEADRRSDLFSVGVVAYEMLAGYNPFCLGGGDPTEVLRRIVYESVPELSPELVVGLPVDIRPAIMAALSKDPDERPQSADQFKRMLHGRAPGYEAGSRPVAVPSRGLSSDSRGRYDGTSSFSNSATEAIDDSTDGRGASSRWIPAVVAGLCAVALLVILLGASSGRGGGGGGAGAGKMGSTLNSSITAVSTTASSATSVSEGSSTSSSAAGRAGAGAAANTVNMASVVAQPSTETSTSVSGPNSVAVPSSTTSVSESGNTMDGNQVAQQGTGADAQPNSSQSPTGNQGAKGSSDDPKGEDTKNGAKDGGNNSANTEAKPTTTGDEAADAFIGRWELVEMKENGVAVVSGEIASAKEVDHGSIAIFSEDKTLELKSFDGNSLLKGTWDAKSAQEGTAKFDGKEIGLKIVNGRLEMSENGSIFTFEKAKTVKTTSKESSISSSATSGSTSNSASLAD